MENKKITTRDLTITAMMAALVFLGTYVFKIPSPTGYIHLGDCMILLTVCLFGTRKGILAGAIGAGLADLIGGYFIWVGPTLVIKAVWALIMGLIMYKALKGRKGSWFIGALVGAIWQIFGYTLVRVPLFGLKAALVEVLPLAFQTLVGGIVLCAVIYGLLVKSGIVNKIRVQYQV